MTRKQSKCSSGLPNDQHPNVTVTPHEIDVTSKLSRLPSAPTLRAPLWVGYSNAPEIMYSTLSTGYYGPRGAISPFHNYMRLQNLNAFNSAPPIGHMDWATNQNRAMFSPIGYVPEKGSAQYMGKTLPAKGNLLMRTLCDGEQQSEEEYFNDQTSCETEMSDESEAESSVKHENRKQVQENAMFDSRECHYPRTEPPYNVQPTQTEPFTEQTRPFSSSSPVVPHAQLYSIPQQQLPLMNPQNGESKLCHQPWINANLFEDHNQVLAPSSTTSGYVQAAECSRTRQLLDQSVACITPSTLI